jgi:hypothetical protein
MSLIPNVLIIIVYLCYLYLSAHNLFGDTDPVLTGLDLFCGATCLGGIALFAALILEGKSSPLARRHPAGAPATTLG